MNTSRPSMNSMRFLPSAVGRAFPMIFILNRVQFETRRFQFRSSPPWATLEGWYYGFQTGRGLDIRASRHSGPVRREPDGARAAELDAGNAGSGGTGGANHPGRHRNASGGVEFPPSAVPRFCRRDIPEGSDD